MSDTFTIGGTALDLDATDAVPVRYSERFGQVPSLTLQRRAIALPGLPDPWLGKAVTWSNGGTQYFVGDVVSLDPPYEDGLGWVINYQCLGLRNRLDSFRHTDAYTGALDSTAYNLPLTDPAYVANRAGRNVGQILKDVLTMSVNAANLTAAGVGNFTFPGIPPVPTLPASTVADLAALTVIPVRPVRFGGDKFGGAMDAFIDDNAPNYKWWISPADGTIRVRDTRTLTPSTLTMGVDPIDPTSLTRDVSDCFQRAQGYGAPVARMFLFKLSRSQITENFAWGALTSSAAKAAWNPATYRAPSTTPGQALDQGTCTCPSTTTITITSSDATAHFIANFWDQTSTGSQGVVNVWYSAGTGITQQWTARIVSNTALTAGGTSTLTIDSPMPITSYNQYTLTGQAVQGPSIVYRKYAIVDHAFWPLVTTQATYPQAVVNAGGGASLMSTAIGVVLWSTSGSAPYNMFPCGISYDGNGNVYFAAPTYIIAGRAPADVWVYLPINVDSNVATSPADISGVPQYAGTSHTQEGLVRTLPVSLPDWIDPGQSSQILAYLADLLDSVKDAVVEGPVRYRGFYAPALTFGMSINIAGDELATFPTGMEALNLAALGVDLAWNTGPGGGTLTDTTIHVSNRRQHYGVDAFMKPPRQMEGFGFEGGGGGGGNPFGIAQPNFSGASTGAAALGAMAGQSTPGLSSLTPDMGRLGSDLGSMAPDLGGMTPNLGGGGDDSGSSEQYEAYS